MSAKGDTAPRRNVTFRPRPGTTHHHALALLAVADMDTAELLAACGGRVTRSEFLHRVLLKLWDNQLTDRLDKTRWRITERGRAVLGQLEGQPADGRTPAAREPARSCFETSAPAEFDLPAGIERWMLTSSPARSMTEADKRPVPVRGDGLEFAQHPSRRGNRLYYRDGRVTDLDGNRIEVSA